MNFAYIWRCTLKSLLRSKTWEELGFVANLVVWVLRRRSHCLKRVRSSTLDTTSSAFTTSTASIFLHIPIIKMQTHPVWTHWAKNLDLMTSLFDLFGNSEKVPYYVYNCTTHISVSHFHIFSLWNNLSNCSQLFTSGCSLEDWWKNVRWCSGYIIRVYRPLSNFASE